MQADLKPSSRATYDSQQRQFVAFCQLKGVPAWPSAREVAEFFLGRALHHYKLSTIEHAYRLSIVGHGTLVRLICEVSSWSAGH